LNKKADSIQASLIKNSKRFRMARRANIKDVTATLFEGIFLAIVVVYSFGKLEINLHTALAYRTV
jgi:hypothetical protein